jgi:hypothetical protein
MFSAGVLSHYIHNTYSTGHYTVLSIAAPMTGWQASSQNDSAMMPTMCTDSSFLTTSIASVVKMRWLIDRNFSHYY